MIVTSACKTIHPVATVSVVVCLYWNRQTQISDKGAIMQRINFFLTASALCLMGAYPSVAAAEVYKCVEKGKITISTEVCPAGATHAEIISDAAPDAASVAAARADEERLQRYAETLARERRERDAAYVAAQKSRAEQAALEAQAQRDIAEAAAVTEPRRGVVYDSWPVYGPGAPQGYGKWKAHRNPGARPPPSGAYRPADASRGNHGGAGLKSGQSAPVSGRVATRSSKSLLEPPRAVE
jgi:hypothetical protein